MQYNYNIFQDIYIDYDHRQVCKLKCAIMIVN